MTSMIETLRVVQIIVDFSCKFDVLLMRALSLRMKNDPDPIRAQKTCILERCWTEKALARE